MSKLQELILHFARKSEGDSSFGAVKLNKLLFYADFAFFRSHGRSITGESYVKRAQGPCPANIVKALKGLEAAKRAATQSTTYFGRPQKKTVALVDADLSSFNGNEIAIVDEVLEWLRDKNASEVSEMSHRELGWELAKDGEVIPYGTALISAEAPNDKEAQFALRFVKQ